MKIETDPEEILRGRTRRHGYNIYQLLESERVLEIEEEVPREIAAHPETAFDD